MRSVKQDLEQKRSALSNAIATIRDGARGTDDRRELLKDPFGTASLTHDDEMAAAVVDRRARELQQVNQALEEIDAGRYGTCRDCGDGLPAARLNVMPFATRCVACQGQMEGLRRAA